MTELDDPWLNTLENSGIKIFMYNKTKIKTIGKKQIDVTNPKNKKKCMPVCCCSRGSTAVTWRTSSTVDAIHNCE